MFGFNSKFIFWIIAALVLISAASAWYIFRFQSNQGLDFAFDVPETVTSGVPFELKLNFSNNSGSVLEDARLALVLPEGATFFGENPNKTIENKSLGNVGDSSLIQETYSIIIFSPEESVKDFKATLNYAPASLGARFEKSKNFSVAIKSSGVAVDLSLPESVTSGEEFDIKIKYQNVSEFDFSGLELKLEYPPSFSFSGASLKPDADNAVWRLGDLRKNSEGEFTVTGSLIGTENQTVDFNSSLSTSVAGNSYLVSRSTASTTVSSSPISLSARLNDDPDYIASAGDTLNYVISYENTTDAPLQNVAVRARLVGEMFDLNTLQTSSAFRSSDATLIWNSANTPALSLLSPGSAGAVNFSIKTKSAYPIKRFSDKNFSVRVNTEAEVLNVPDTLGVKRVYSVYKLENKILGNISVDAQAYFRDAAACILNGGLMPPKVGQATQFTVHWLIKNFANDASNVEARAVLGNNVKITQQAKSNVGSVPAVDPATNELVWKIDRIQANQGVVGSQIEAIFQVEVVPAGEQAGTYMQLIGPTTVKAHDDFADRELVNNDVALTTALPDDTTVGQQRGVVQP